MNSKVVYVALAIMITGLLCAGFYILGLKRAKSQISVAVTAHRATIDCTPYQSVSVIGEIVLDSFLLDGKNQLHITEKEK